MLAKFMFVMIIVMISLIFVINSNRSEAIDLSNDNELIYSTSLMPESIFFEEYDKLAAPESVVVVYPILTQSAYSLGGIHDYYAGYCGDCTVASIENFYDPIYSVGGNSFRILEFLGYDVVNDLMVDKDPKILRDYDTVILLHNEFVTKQEFSAIISHPNVIYLYPGSLSAEVKINYGQNSMELVRGPQYPQNNIDNGFEWSHDNSQYDTNTECTDWKFYSIDNGYMLDCYPEYEILTDEKLLQKIKELSLL